MYADAGCVHKIRRHQLPFHSDPVASIGYMEGVSGGTDKHKSLLDKANN